MVIHDFQTIAYVFMPDHVHLLIHPQGESYQVSDILKSIKQGVSRRALIDEVLWEPGRGHDRNISTPEARQNAISYIHMNPDRKELCTDIIEYRWSSARSFELGERGEIDVLGSG